MRVDLKALGLAVLAALAMSVVTASAAHATNAEFFADTPSAVAKGSQEGGVNYFESTPGQKIECTTATYQATVGASRALTVTPHYAGCIEGKTIHLNGCHFVFETAGTEKNGATPGTVDVICASSKTIEITGAFGICQVHIQGIADGKNQNLTGVTFTNVDNGDVTIDIDITNQLHYTDTDTSFCPFTANTTGTDGDFYSNVLLRGFAYGGSAVSHPVTTGIVTYNVGAVENISVT